MEVIVGLTAVCVIVAILTTHFCGYRAPKKQSEILSRVEARYFESSVHYQQQGEFAAAEKEAEVALRKGLIDGIEDIPSGFRQ